MAFTRIEQADLLNKGVIGLPDTPGLSTAAMQAKMEETARDVIIPKHNALLDELEDTTSASSLGASAPTGRPLLSPTVQGVMDKLSADLKVVEDGMAEAIQDAHTHDNKELLDTYEQTEANLADAVTKKHEHSNKALLDTYTQSDTDIADAVTKKHEHSNKALLDTYTQSDTDLADAVSNKHSHTNKAVIDKFGEDSGGNPTYDGNPIGGGGSADAYKTIKVGTTTLTASGADTIEFVADDNIILTPDATTTPKQIKIKSTGGGTGSASWGGISGTLSNQTDLQTALNAKADSSSLATVATSGAYADLSGQPSIPTVTDTYSGTSSDGMSGVAVASAISGKADTSSLGDLAYIDIDGRSSTKVLQGDGTWVTPSSGGHTMIPVAGDMNAIAALNNGNDNYVVNAYSAKRWSNCDAKIVLTTASQNADGVGTWNADNVWETDGVRTGWLWSADFYQILEDGNGNAVTDIEVIPIFDIGNSEAVGLASYRIDDDYPQTINGVTVNGGCVAFKFTGAIKNASGVKVGLKLVHQRTDVNDGTILT